MPEYSQDVTKKFAVLALVTVVAIGLRFYHLGSLPSGFHNDEASFQWNAYSLLQTGRDEDGNAWPLYLKSYIDPKPALYSYLQIPFIQLIGLSEWSARLPAVIVGVLSLFFVYQVLGKLGLDSKRSIGVVILLAISPWHVLVSRATQEVILSFGFGMVTLWMWLLFAQHVQAKKKNWLLIGGVLALCLLGFALALYSYHSAKVVLPLLLFGVFLYHDGLKRPIAGLVSGVLLCAVLILVVFGGGGFTRFQAVNIFTQSDTQLILNEQIGTATGHVPGFFIRVFHNKVVNTGYAVATVYLQHFSGSFLFLSGGQPDRYDVPWHGLLFQAELVFLLIGGVASFANRRFITQKKLTFLMLWWLIVAPLPAALTVQEVPSTIRAFWMIVPLMYFVGVGVEAIVQLQLPRKSKVLNRVLFLVLSLGVTGAYGWGLSYFWHQFTVFQPYYHPWSRNVADQKMAAALIPIHHKYSQVTIGRFTGQPYPYLALAGLIQPTEIQNSNAARLRPEFNLGKYYFSTSSCPLKPSEGELFIIRFNCPLPIGYREVTTGLYLDNNDGYRFVEWSQALFERESLRPATPAQPPQRAKN